MEMDEISVVELFFKSHQVLFSRPWLESCINWCKEENLPANYSVKDLQYNVFEQWLLLDLRDIEVPCLPPNLSAKIKYTLTGNYSLQMMQIIDISKPKYWQMQRIRNGIPKNLDQDVESSKRVLLVTLTDGIQQIEAMELRPIQCLSLNLSPGIKIRLMGPIEIRRGRLMLENKHVKILGGEVDSLIIENAAENILAKHLKLPLNPNPTVIQESLLTANTDMFNETGFTSHASNVTHNSTLSQPIRQQASLRSNNLQKPSINDSRKNLDIGSGTKNTKLTRDEIDYIELEEQRLNEEIDILMEVERDFEEAQVKRRKLNKTPDIFDDMDIGDCNFENIDIVESDKPSSSRLVGATKKPSSKSEAPSTPNDTKPVVLEKTPEIVNFSDTLELENDVFENLDIDAHLDKIEEKTQPSQPPTPKIWSVKKLVENIPNISNGKFRIKVKFKSIVEKMIIIDDEYHLVIKVEDDTGDINVRMHSDVVAGFTGCSTSDLMKLRSEVAENNSAAQAKFFEALKALKEKLLLFDEIVEVHVNVREKFPVVLKFL